MREFVNSWDKELYELTYLDYFIFLLINYIGDQLEKRFFNQRHRHTELFLDFEQLGTLCFNIGDALEFFLEENCLGSCPLNCPLNLDGIVNDTLSNLEHRIQRKLIILRTFLSRKLDKEQCLRVDLMNHVIMDTLIQYYQDEFQIELSEENLNLMDMAEFIEDIIIDFIRLEGKNLLSRHSETAIEIFENLLQSEFNEESEENWYEDTSEHHLEYHKEEWQKSLETIDEVFKKFSSDEHYNSPETRGVLTGDLMYFKRFLNDEANLKRIYDLQEDHIAEFLSIWLVKEFVLKNDQQIQNIFRALARFITYINQNYNINLKREFLKYYEAVKSDLPRVVKAMNTFIDEYNVLASILNFEADDSQIKTGIFEITQIHGKNSHLFDVQDLNIFQKIDNIFLDSSAFYKLREGDILNASLIEESDGWKVLDIQFIYPNLAKRFLRGFE